METWKIQDKTVTYEDETHTYFVEGKKCISVTQLLHFKFPKKYEGIDPAVLERAAKKGTEMHEAIQNYEEIGVTRNDLIEFRNYLFLKQMYKFESLENEVPILISYKGLYVCGRLDQALKIENMLGLNDFKRTSTLDIDYLTYQLNIYRIGYIQSYNKNIERLFATHLREDKRKFIELKINEEMAYALFDAYIERENNNE